MQSLPIYLYDNTIGVILDLDPATKGVTQVMYQRDLNIQKGIKNKVRVQFKNSDQKSLSLSNTSTFVFTMFDTISNRSILEKQVKILDDSVILNTLTDQTSTSNTLNISPTGISIGQSVTGFGIPVNTIVTGVSTNTVTLNNVTNYAVSSSTELTFGTQSLRGLGEIWFTESDTLDFDVSEYKYNIKYADPIWGGYVPAYANTYYGISGTLNLLQDTYPVLQPSQEIVSFLKSYNQQTLLYEHKSGNVYAYPEYNSNSALHTMAIYMTNFKGQIIVQGTLSNQPDSTGQYYTIKTLNYTGFNGIDYVNFNGVYTYVRVVYIPATAPGDSGNDNQIYFGNLDKILYRS
jgi:hypothetical protein